MRANRRRAQVLAYGVALAVAIAATSAFLASPALGDARQRVAVRGGKSGPLHGLILTPAPVVSALSLPDAAAEGAELPFVGPPGGLLLVYFGYTSCPDVCPSTLSDLGVALHKLGAKAQRVRVAMATVDPERDTAAVLTGYLEHFLHSGYSALRTDDPVQLRTVADAFGAKYEVAKTAAGKTEVGHSAYVYAVDDKGRVVLAWPFGVSTRALAADLRVLLRRA